MDSEFLLDFFCAVHYGAGSVFLWGEEWADARFLNIEIHVWSLVIMVLFCVGCVFFVRASMFGFRHPMAYHWVQMLGGSFRIFYLGSLLWLFLSGVVWWAFLVVVALWVFSELTNYYEVHRIKNDEVAQAFRKRFRLSSEGYLLYNPIASIKELHSSNRAPWVKWRDKFEILGAAIGVIVGPVFFIRSQLYRENFEPRFLIAAGFMLALALALRSLSTEVAIARRAINLKKKEDF